MATRTASGDALSRDWTVASALELCVWRGKAIPPAAQLACKLLASVPNITKRFTVIVLADAEFGTIEFLKAVRKHWRAVVGMRSNRQMENGKTLRQLYRTGKRGQQVRLVGIIP